MYKFLCITYIFFKKYFNAGQAPLYKFSHFYIKLYDDFYVIRLRNLRATLGNVPVYCMYWFFFVFLHHVYFCRRSIYMFIQILNFWNFLFYTVFSGKIIFGVKSAKVASIFWPKYIYTPEDLFDLMIRDSLREKKGVYEISFLKRKKRNIKIRKTSNYFSRKFRILLNMVNFLKKKKNIKRKNLVKKMKKIKNTLFFPITNLVKFFFNFKIKESVIFFIRKQKFFNKGRYSRNRQLYRTGVYWCIYVNIIAVLGLNFLFYKFSVNFLQYWWFFYVILLFFVFSYFFKSSTYAHLQNLYMLIYYVPNFFFLKKIGMNIYYYFDYKIIYNYLNKIIYNFFE